MMVRMVEYARRSPVSSSDVQISLAVAYCLTHRTVRIFRSSGPIFDIMNNMLSISCYL